MLSASLRAYQGGTDTLPARRQIVVDYLNSTPLAAAPGYGEVLGLGRWAVGLVRGGARSDEPAALRRRRRLGPARAQAYRRVLSLLLAAAPAVPLPDRGPGRARRVHRPLSSRLARAGVIDHRLRDAALGQRLRFRQTSPPAPSDWSERKGANLVRARLTSLLGVPALYDLDRLDLTAQSTLDGPVSGGGGAGRSSPCASRPPSTALGLRGFHLLERGEPGPRDLQLHRSTSAARAATSCACRPTTSISRSTSTPAPGSTWARRPSCAR